MHYWYGCIDTPSSDYPQDHKKFRVLMDNIKLIKDLGNEIPNKSWMLYLLEIFNIQRQPVELNLICQYDDQNYFEAIFKGKNQYRFNRIIPMVGGSYQREIWFKESESKIQFILKDLVTNAVETFDLQINEGIFGYQFNQCFTGAEWWNRIRNCPYPLRFEVFVSKLMYGYNDNSLDSSSMIFFPIGNIFENKDGNTLSYPVTIEGVHRIDGCICYSMR
jgi:hypothetical protein